MTNRVGSKALQFPNKTKFVKYTGPLSKADRGYQNLWLHSFQDLQRSSLENFQPSLRLDPQPWPFVCCLLHRSALLSRYVKTYVFHSLFHRRVHLSLLTLCSQDVPLCILYYLILKLIKLELCIMAHVHFPSSQLSRYNHNSYIIFLPSRETSIEILSTLHIFSDPYNQ